MGRDMNNISLNSIRLCKTTALRQTQAETNSRQMIL